MKKLIAMLLAAIMAISVLPAAAFAAEDNGSTGPVWPEEGSIKLDKDAKAVEGRDNLWEVTLRIQGKNYRTTSDVVLVIDNSNSMYTEKGNGYTEDANSRMTKTKIAAKAFVNALLTEDSATRIALVVYGTDVRSFTGFYDADGKNELIGKINAITVEADSDNGGTNQQAGIHKAQELLDSADSTGRNKSMVILSDGAATFSYPFVGGSASIDCRTFLIHRFSGNPQVTTWPANAVPDYTTVVGTGGDFSLDGNILWNCKCTHNKMMNKGKNCTMVLY